MIKRSWFQKAYSWLAGIGRYLRSIILDMLDDAFKDFMDLMGPVIEGILRDIQNDPSIITDDDRRKAAYEKIKSAAKENGVTIVKDSLIYRAIEILIGALKNRGDMPDNSGA